MSLDTEFNNQEMTILLLRIHACSKFDSETGGLSIDPSIKPNLFLTESNAHRSAPRCKVITHEWLTQAQDLDNQNDEEIGT